MKKNIMAQIEVGYSLNEYLDRVYDKSGSERSRATARTSIKHFEIFCKHEKMSVNQVIEQFRTWIKENDFQSVYIFLDKWISFMSKDHEDVEMVSFFGKDITTLKKHGPRTIRVYFAFTKSWLRMCHKIRLLQEDIADYVQFPKVIQEQRKPLDVETIKLILENCSKKRRCLYLVLLSSGMRIGEALALRRKHFDLNSDPCKVTIPAGITKTKTGRESYISSEAKRLLLKIINDKEDKFKTRHEKKDLTEEDKKYLDNERVFGTYDEIYRAVVNEGQRFGKLRRSINLTEKYEDSPRNTVTIHTFRRFFHTKASNKHGSDYANAMDGHSGYLKQYYALDEQERIKKYKELEPHLLIYSSVTETAKDKKITEMEKEMSKMKAKMARLEDMYEIK